MLFFAFRLTVRQMTIQATNRLEIGEDVLIDAFHSQLKAVANSQSPGYRLRIPFLTQIGFDLCHTTGLIGGHFAL